MITLLLSVLQQDGGSTAGGGGSIFPFISWLLVTAGMWKVFTKAGQPGWAAIIPIYNFYVLLKVIGKPIWWLVLLIVFPVFWILSALALANSFGKGIGFAIGLMLLGPIFLPILGFGDAKYVGTADSARAVMV